MEKKMKQYRALSKTNPIVVSAVTAAEAAAVVVVMIRISYKAFQSATIATMYSLPFCMRRPKKKILERNRCPSHLDLTQLEV